MKKRNLNMKTQCCIVKLNKVNIAITNEKLNKEDMARLLGRGGVGDFGGCVANKKSFICFSVYQLQNTSSGAGQKYFSSYQLCWEASYLSAVDWERSPSISASSSLIITITAIFSIFNSTKKTKSPISKLHLLNVTRQSFCDPIEKKMRTQ